MDRPLVKYSIRKSIHKVDKRGYQYIKKSIHFRHFINNVDKKVNIGKAVQ